MGRQPPASLTRGYVEGDAPPTASSSNDMSHNQQSTMDSNSENEFSDIDSGLDSDSGIVAPTAEDSDSDDPMSVSSARGTFQAVSQLIHTTQPGTAAATPAIASTTIPVPTTPTIAMTGKAQLLMQGVTTNDKRPNDFDGCIQSRDGFQFLLAYLYREYSEEALLCYKQILMLQSKVATCKSAQPALFTDAPSEVEIDDPIFTQIFRDFERMHDHFIAADSPLQVNISDDARKFCKDIVKDLEDGRCNAVTLLRVSDAMSKVYSQLMQLLKRDSWVRFTKSPIFSDYLKGVPAPASSSFRRGHETLPMSSTPSAPPATPLPASPSIPIASSALSFLSSIHLSAPSRASSSSVPSSPAFVSKSACEAEGEEECTPLPSSKRRTSELTIIKEDTSSVERRSSLLTSQMTRSRRTSDPPTRPPPQRPSASPPPLPSIPGSPSVPSNAPVASGSFAGQIPPPLPLMAQEKSAPIILTPPPLPAAAGSAPTSSSPSVLASLQMPVPNRPGIKRSESMSQSPQLASQSRASSSPPRPGFGASKSRSDVLLSELDERLRQRRMVRDAVVNQFLLDDDSFEDNNRNTPSPQPQPQQSAPVRRFSMVRNSPLLNKVRRATAHVDKPLSAYRPISAHTVSDRIFGSVLSDIWISFAAPNILASATIHFMFHEIADDPSILEVFSRRDLTKRKLKVSLFASTTAARAAPPPLPNPTPSRRGRSSISITTQPTTPLQMPVSSSYLQLAKCKTDSFASGHASSHFTVELSMLKSPAIAASLNAIPPFDPNTDLDASAALAQQLSFLWIEISVHSIASRRVLSVFTLPMNSVAQSSMNPTKFCLRQLMIADPNITQQRSSD